MSKLILLLDIISKTSPDNLTTCLAYQGVAADSRFVHRPCLSIGRYYCNNYVYQSENKGIIKDILLSNKSNE